MKPIDQMLLIERIDGLIRRKQTGTPKELAERLEIPERSLFRLIHEMREVGLPIKFSIDRQTYFYDGETPLHIHIYWDYQDKKK